MAITVRPDDAEQAFGSAYRYGRNGPTGSTGNMPIASQPPVMAGAPPAAAANGMGQQEQALADHYAQHGGPDMTPPSQMPSGGKIYAVPTMYGGVSVPPQAAHAIANYVGLDRFPSYANAQAAQQRLSALPFMRKAPQAMPPQQGAAPANPAPAAQATQATVPAIPLERR